MSDFNFGNPDDNDFQLDVPADFTGGPDSDGNQDFSIPDGFYVATLVGLTNYTSVAGNKNLKFEFKIQNRPKPSRYPESYYVGKDAKSQERLARTLAAIGCPQEDGRFKVKDFSDLLGRECKVYMERDAPYEGKIRSKVKYVAKLENS